MKDKAHIIAVDWGTTHFRAYCITANGEILAERNNEYGASCLAKDEFASFLKQEIAYWNVPSVPILICGMAGSSIGWHDVGYIDCPTGLSNIAKHCYLVDPEIPAWIVPGLRCITSEGQPDVMRGEETQLLGWMEKQPCYTGLIILPGTHSKWVSIVNGSIEYFASAITGELYMLLADHSILAFNTDQVDHKPSFEQGLEWAERSYILHQLFTIRALTLAGKLAVDHRASYLSGLLIGSEIKQMLNLFTDELKSDIPVTVIGSKDLVKPYEHGLKFFGLSSQSLLGQAASIAGLLNIEKQLR